MRCATLRKKEKKTGIKTIKKGGAKLFKGTVNDKKKKDGYRGLKYIDNTLKKLTHLDYVSSDKKIENLMEDINTYFDHKEYNNKYNTVRSSKEENREEPSNPFSKLISKNIFYDENGEDIKRYKRINHYRKNISLFRTDEKYRIMVYSIINQLIEECINAIESYEVEYNLGSDKKRQTKRIYKMEDFRVLSTIQNTYFSILESKKVDEEKNKELMKLKRNIYELIMSTKPTTNIINRIGLSDDLMRRIFQNYINTGKEYIEKMKGYHIYEHFNDSFPYFDTENEKDDLHNFNFLNKVLMFIKDRLDHNKDVNDEEMDPKTRKMYFEIFELYQKWAGSNPSYNKMSYFFAVHDNYDNMFKLKQRYESDYIQLIRSNYTNVSDLIAEYNTVNEEMGRYIQGIEDIICSNSNDQRIPANNNDKWKSDDEYELPSKKEYELIEELEKKALSQEDFYLSYLNKINFIYDLTCPRSYPPIEPERHQQINLALRQQIQ